MHKSSRNCWVSAAVLQNCAWKATSGRNKNSNFAGTWFSVFISDCRYPETLNFEFRWIIYKKLHFVCEAASFLQQTARVVPPTLETRNFVLKIPIATKLDFKRSSLSELAYRIFHFQKLWKSLYKIITWLQGGQFFEFSQFHRKTSKSPEIMRTIIGPYKQVPMSKSPAETKNLIVELGLLL